MVQKLLAKFLRLTAALTGAVLIIFLLMHAIPGNPWSNYSSARRLVLAEGSDQALLRELNRRFGTDLPMWRQFTRYMIGDTGDGGVFVCGLICGNLGPSIQRRNMSVQEALFATPPGKTGWQSPFGYSLRLVLLASVFVAGIGIPLGILSASRPRSKISRFIVVGLAVLNSIPNFVIGYLLIVVLAVWLNMMRVILDWNQVGSWIIPALILAIPPLAALARLTNAAVSNTLSEEYVRTARAKGLTQARVLLVHVLRNALVPILTFLGPALMEMFPGLLVVENLYGFPGIGREYWDAVLELDYPMIMGLTIVYAAGILLVNGLAEFLGERLDPRLRSSPPQGAT